MVNRRFRLVCVFNKESGRYHTYLTNIPVEILAAEDIALLYAARWEIELICLIWIAILTLICSRRILRLIQNANPENANRLLTEVLECVGLKLDMLT